MKELQLNAIPFLVEITKILFDYKKIGNLASQSVNLGGLICL